MPDIRYGGIFFRESAYSFLNDAQGGKNLQKGLSSEKAAALLKEHGENILQEEKRRGAFLLFADQFKDFLTLILLLSAVVSLFLGEVIDAFTIMAIVFLNAVLGFSQEYRTEKTMEKLQALSAPKAAVLRDGSRTEIPAAALVPSDIVFLSAGGKVPADGVLLEQTGLFCDEALLTGESLPVEKAVSEEVFMGTLVTAGHGIFRVTKTGMETAMGKIARLLSSAKEEATPLQKKLGALSKWIAALCLLICFSVTLVGILRGENAFEMFLTGLSLSVAAIPEGLTAVITISLGLAVSRMLKRNALVRRLHAVETLGCADVICSDKTGTLTENCMTVTEVFTPEGTILTKKDFQKAPKRLFEAAALCNNAGENAAKGFSGEPTETALLAWAFEHGGKEIRKSAERLSERPFDSARKRMSVLVRLGDGKTLVFTKGAPDMLLGLCQSVLSEGKVVPMSTAEKARCQDALSAMAKEALRVLAFACKETEDAGFSEDGLIFLGFCGLMDPPRKGARASVLKCRKAGIKAVMITGDHPDTALAIAQKLGIAKAKDRVLVGKELDSLSPAEFRSACESVSVFARVTPAHKLKIVRTLRENGHIVAMTGDGVNDAPAVKEADIGVSMGKNGTDVTREASGIVLLDDDFSTLVSAVEEGRVIYQNIRKVIRYLLSCNIGEVVTMFFGMLLGFPAVLLPIQILMVNLITDGIPAIALSFDPAQDDVMTLPPRGRDESVFSGGLAKMIVLRGIFLGLSVLLAFLAVLKSSEDLAAARTAAYVTLVFTQLVAVFECKSEDRSLFTIRFGNNKKLLAAALSSAVLVLGTVLIKPAAAIFGVVPLTKSGWLAVFAATFAVPFFSSVFHFLCRKK